MNIIVCVDDSLGMSFNNRRQSKDSALVRNIMKITEDNRLFVSEYSASLFKNEDVIVDNNLLENAQVGDYCFVEKSDILQALDKIEKVIIYRWNRAYPSDKKFPLAAATNGKTLVYSCDFAGTSHDKITMEIYQ